MSLHSFGSEEVYLIKIEPNIELENSRNLLGEELLVLEGELFNSKQSFTQGTWIREAYQSTNESNLNGVFTKENGLTALVKKGHFPE